MNVRRFGLWLVAAGLVVAGSAGCTDDSSRFDRPGATQVTRVATADDVRDQQGNIALDEPLMIALAQAKNFHHKARVYRSDGNLDAAITAVREVMAVPFPDDAPEAVDVRLDARALLATLLAERGDLVAALEVVQTGIDGATRDSFFLANLFTVKGELLRARAETQAVGTDASADRRAAIEALDRSIAINLEIQRRLEIQNSPPRPGAGATTP